MTNIEPLTATQHLCSLQVTSERIGAYRGYLVIRRSEESLEGLPRYGLKLEIPGTHKSRQDLSNAGTALFARYLKGEVSPLVHSEKVKFCGYRLVGSARFHAMDLKWEPLLELKKIEEPNKGRKQTIMGHDTAFARNLFPSADGAAKFAIEFGKRLVMDHSKELEI